MAGRSQCRHCGVALGSGTNYCTECGTPQTLIVFDPLDVEDPPVIRGTDTAPHARLTMLAGLTLVFAVLAVLWGLSREGDPADEEPLSSETPEDGVSGADPATSTTTVVTTTASTRTASTTTGAETTGSEQVFVNDVQGPVLSDDVHGVVVQLFGRTMRQIDLATGAIERIGLEHVVIWDGPESAIVVNGNLVSYWSRVITTTDLSDGSQREPREITDGSFATDPALSDNEEGPVVGRADVDSIWLATYPEPDQISEAIEVDLDGEVRRQVQIPQPFSIEWAQGDELILGSVDGSFRYDTLTGSTVRMPGAVLAFEPGFVITASCNDSLQCDVLLDQGNGPEVVEWLSVSDVFDGSIDLSPDLSGALLHVDGQFGRESTFINLATGSRVDLGHLPIEPSRGVIWVEDSRWIIGHNDSPDDSPDTLLAIDTATGTQVDLELPSGIPTESFLAFIPAN